MTSAGIGIPQVIAQLRRKPPAAGFRAPLGLVGARIEAGSTFSDAIESVPGWLPAFDIALLRAAEMSGRLPASFLLLARYYRERARLGRALLGTLVYPFILLHMAVLVFPTSQLTGLVLQGEVGAFLMQKILVLGPIYGFVAFAILAGQGSHGEKWRSFVERILAWVPVLGGARRSLALSRLSAALEGLISAGVSIVTAWELAAEACGSAAIRRAVAEFTPAVEAGTTPSEAISRYPEFPEFFANYYHSGEISGKLDESLRQLHQVYQDEGSRKMRQFVAGLGGLVFLGVMLSVAWNIISFWLGYFDNIGKITEP